MLRIYSKGCEYVMRVLSRLDALEKGKSFSLRKICGEENIPEWFTRKVFQNLVHAGYLNAFRGPGGGYQFKGKPEKISVLSMIQAIDGPDILDHCIMGSEKCSERKKCLMHPRWLKIKKALVRELGSLTLNELIGSMPGKDNSSN